MTKTSLMLWGAATIAILVSSAVQAGAQIYGTEQGNLKLPNGDWNYGATAIHDFSAGKIRIWWTCGKANNLYAICYGEANAYDAWFVDVAINAVNYGLCDIADPTVVKFNGAWYMYVTGIRWGNVGCSTGSNGNIYAFRSYDARNWTILNGGQPVISIPDTNSYGVGQPSAIVMNYTYTCSGGRWYANPTSPFIRVYHTQSALQPDPGHALYAKDTEDGVHFEPHCCNSRGKTGILNGDLIPPGWWPSVKKVGLFGDYPLVISFSYLQYQLTAVTGVDPYDFNWSAGNWGGALVFIPTATTTALLESDPTGRLLSDNGGFFTGAPTGRVVFRWSSEPASQPPSVFLGTAETARYFPWDPTVGQGSCGY